MAFGVAVSILLIRGNRRRADEIRSDLYDA